MPPLEGNQPSSIYPSITRHLGFLDLRPEHLGKEFGHQHLELARSDPLDPLEKNLILICPNCSWHLLEIYFGESDQPLTQLLESGLEPTLGIAVDLREDLRIHRRIRGLTFGAELPLLNGKLGDFPVMEGPGRVQLLQHLNSSLGEA